MWLVPYTIGEYVVAGLIESGIGEPKARSLLSDRDGLVAPRCAGVHRRAPDQGESLAARRRRRSHTFFGTLPVRVNMKRIALCPRSAVGSNINGQPPSMTVIPCWRPYWVAASDTLLPPGP